VGIGLEPDANGSSSKRNRIDPVETSGMIRLALGNVTKQYIRMGS